MKKKIVFAVLIICAVILSSCVIDHPDKTIVIPDDAPVEYVGSANWGCMSFSLYSDRTAVLIDIDTEKEIDYHAANEIPEIVDIKYTVTEIGKGAFENLPFENIVIPDTVTKISERAFRRTNIKSIVIPENVTYIGEESFDNCTKLVSCEIKCDLPEIQTGTFFNCTSLERINIPDSVTKIGDDAFSMCTSLKEFVFPENIAEIGSYAFHSSAVKNPGFPASVKIGEYAFDN